MPAKIILTLQKAAQTKKNQPRSYRLEAGADEAEDSDFLQEKIVARLSELHQIGKTAGAVYLKAQQNLLKRLERIKNANQYVESLLKMSVVVGEFKRNFLLWLLYMKMFGDSEINLLYETTT